MLINVLVIVLKVFWIEVALFWRDIVTPYRIQNGEYQVQDSLHQERFHSDYGVFLSIDVMLLNPILFSL